ncbi:MAG TPA: type II toxin-antitoxin system VapC family toxin [Terriglobales bacterium]|nr:type II toxin-antitoxin system VapC family toxin [Terriglobales bacterium]
MILLDTHAVLWLVIVPERLSRAAASAIRRARASDGIAIADITLLELAILFSRGAVRHRGTLESAVQQIVDSSRANVRSITPEIAALATQFPNDFPRDPADRLIGATSRAEGISLITRDERIRSSPLLKTIW